MSQAFLEQVEQYSELITDAIDGVGVARRAEALSHYKWDEIKPLLQDRDELPGVDWELLRNVIRQMDLLDKLNSRAMVDHMTIDQADTSHRLMMSICRCLYLIFFHRGLDIKDGQIIEQDVRDKDTMDATLDILKNFMPTQTLQWAGTHSTAWQDGTIQVIAYLEYPKPALTELTHSAMRVVKDWLRKGTLPATNKPNLFNEVADEALDLAMGGMTALLENDEIDEELLELYS
ncbi:MAG: hypothetical protein Q9206_006767 [Seirophora lacunosa]